MAKSKKQVKLTLDRETKGAVRYAEDDSDPMYLLGTVYLRKAGMQSGGLGSAIEGWPKEITVTIEA